MPVIPFRGTLPRIHPSVFIAPDAWVTGQVSIGEDCSVFFGTVLRGDINSIQIGSATNIQEKATLHTSRGLGPCIIGNRVSIGHHAIVHGCTVADECIIGMGAVLLDGVEVGKNCIIGAQALVPTNTKIPENSLVVGVPATVIRTITDKEREGILRSAASYVEVGREYERQFSQGTVTGNPHS